MTVLELCSYLSEWQFILIYKGSSDKIRFSGQVKDLPEEFYFDEVERIGIRVLNMTGPHLVVTAL